MAKKQPIIKLLGDNPDNLEAYNAIPLVIPSIVMEATTRVNKILNYKVNEFFSYMIDRYNQPISYDDPYDSAYSNLPVLPEEGYQYTLYRHNPTNSYGAFTQHLTKVGNKIKEYVAMGDTKSLTSYLGTMANMGESNDTVQLATGIKAEYKIHEGVLWFPTLDSYRRWTDTDNNLGIFFRDLWPKDSLAKKAWFKWIPDSPESYIDEVLIIEEEGKPDYRIFTPNGIGLAWFRPTKVDTNKIEASDKSNIYEVIKQLTSSFGEDTTT